MRMIGRATGNFRLRILDGNVAPPPPTPARRWAGCTRGFSSEREEGTKGVRARIFFVSARLPSDRTPALAVSHEHALRGRPFCQSAPTPDMRQLPASECDVRESRLAEGGLSAEWFAWPQQRRRSARTDEPAVQPDSALPSAVSPPEVASRFATVDWATATDCNRLPTAVLGVAESEKRAGCVPSQSRSATRTSQFPRPARWLSHSELLLRCRRVREEPSVTSGGSAETRFAPVLPWIVVQERELASGGLLETSIGWDSQPRRHRGLRARQHSLVVEQASLCGWDFVRGYPWLTGFSAETANAYEMPHNTYGSRGRRCRCGAP
jgi:hypothetical protein